MESMVPKGQLLERDFSRTVLLSSGVPEYTRKNLYGNTSVSCSGMVFLLVFNEGKPFFAWYGIPYKLVCIHVCVKF